MNGNVRANYAVGNTGKTVTARLLPGTDLLTGIEELCKKTDITYASIVTCFGSFRKAGYFYLVPKPESKAGAGYGELTTIEGPVEFLNGTGIVCMRDGIYETHLHGTFCDKEGKVYGGHMVKGENPVITVDLILSEIVDVDLYRRFDDETGANQFYPVGKGETKPFQL
ncbi:PPC domain-containing DNA-binding protein [Ferdinandcohnia sp. Marseille-Q9671]